MPTLNPDQVQLVLRRAAELEQRGKPEAAVAATGQMTRGDITQIADEVGLQPDAIQRALAELDAGLLTRRSPITVLDRLIGPGDVVLTRSVAGPAAEVRAHVDGFLRGQLMQVRRNLGELGMVWEPASDFVSRMRRAFDISKRLRLPPDCELETAVVPDPEDSGHVLVRLSLRLGEPRRKRALQAVTGALAGVALAAAGIAAFHTAPFEAASIAAGSVTAVGTWATVRSNFRRDLERAETGLLRFLDTLEHERR